MSWFGPPLCVTKVSTCTWVDHSVSGLLHKTKRSIKTRFRFGYDSILTLLYTVSRRLIMQKACRRDLTRRHFVDVQFQDLFHSPLGVLFAFPSRYLFTIAH